MSNKENDVADKEKLESWEIEAVGAHGLPVLDHMAQLKARARRNAGRNDEQCFLLLLEERLLNDLVVDATSAWLDVERVANHITAHRYRVGATQTEMFRALVA